MPNSWSVADSGMAFPHQPPTAPHPTTSVKTYYEGLPEGADVASSFLAHQLPALPPELYQPNVDTVALKIGYMNLYIENQ